MRRRIGNSRTPTWILALWGLALLSLFLLPSDFRAGSRAPHGHSLFQLWLDAADGRIDHHHDGVPASATQVRADWLDPRVDQEPAAPASKNARPDVPEQNDSAPSVSGIHLLLMVATILPIIAGAALPSHGGTGRLVGRAPRVLSPPPRWTLVSA